MKLIENYAVYGEERGAAAGVNQLGGGVGGGESRSLILTVKWHAAQQANVSREV